MNQHTRMCTKIFIKKKKDSAIAETSKNQNTDPSYLRQLFLGFLFPSLILFPRPLCFLLPGCKLFAQNVLNNKLT